MNPNTSISISYPEKNLYRIMLTLAGLWIIFFIGSMYHRIITLDDAWFAEQAYWFAKDGYVHSELFEGFPIFAHQILVYLKLHIWQGALVYKLFGWSAYYFKAIAIPYLLLFLGLIFYFLKHIAPMESRKGIFAIFLLFLFANHLVFQEGFEYRPEVPMMCIGFLSYIFLYYAQQKNDYRFAILSGLMAGITALLHLNGLIFIAAGGLVLLFQRNFKLAFWFGLGALFGFLPYFYQLTSLDKLKHYLFDLTHDPAVSKQDRTITGMLIKLLHEYHRFTHHIYEFSYLVVFIITLVFNWRHIKQNPKHKNLLLYLLFLTIFMALITTGSKTSYLLCSMPYVLLLISIYFRQVFSYKKVVPLFLFFVVIYFLTNLDRDHGVITDRKNDPPQLYAHIIDKYHIKPGAKIFAPATFIFNEIGKVHIQGFIAYLVKYHHDLAKVTVKNVLGDIYRRGKSFAILTPTMLKDLKLDPQQGKVYAGYKYLGRESDLYIFKRLSNRTSQT